MTEPEKVREVLANALGVLDYTHATVGDASRQANMGDWAVIHVGRAKSSMRQMKLLSEEIRELLDKLEAEE